MKVYVVNKIWSSMDEAAEHFTEVFLDLDKAKEYINKEEQEWLQDKKANWFQDEPEDVFDDWLNDALVEDIYNNDYMYRHYVYSDGEEKIFELLTKEISE